MRGNRAPRGFIGKRLYQLQHAPRPVFRAVLASGGSGLVFMLIYLAYDLHVERALISGVAPSLLAGGGDLRTEAAALVVLCTATFGSLLTYLIVPQPSADGTFTTRSGWSALLGLFASLPIAYIGLVIESQFLKPFLLAL
ncbi:MAG: hypothetical protein ACKO8J_02420 [Candidatus Limnocylindrus sp.]|jgi:hypothetical protein